MKLKWVALVIALVVAVYYGINIYAEVAYYDSIVSELNRTLAVASEQAVSQVLASDELFTATGDTGVYNNTSYTTVKTADGLNNEYTDENLFEIVYKTNDKDTLYLRMFQNNALFNDLSYMQEICKVQTSVGGEFNIPLISRMGLLSQYPEMLSGDAYTYLKNVVDNSGYTASMTQFSGRDWMHIYEVEKRYNNSNQNVETYYLAPTNVGITYLDPNLLQTAFASNMDMLMRAKYAMSGDVSQGTGVPNVIFGGGEDYVLTNDLKEFAYSNNIINNGKFAYVKGRRSSSVGVGYTGGENANGAHITPTVSYKVVDVCDLSNEQLIRMAVSEIAGPSDVEGYKQWLLKQGINIADGPHYCVVAQITFYADIIVPYSTPITRNLYSLYQRGTSTTRELFQININEQTMIENNMPNLYVTEKDMISGITGNPYFTYTTYAAIMA